MKTYQIHLIRHAVTKGNLEGRYIGHTDESVCEEGMAQLKDIMENYGEYPQVDAVFSSPLKRCTETAKIPMESRFSEMKSDKEMQKPLFSLGCC